MPLNDAKAKHVKAGEKPIKLSDGGGLYLLVQPNGSKLWRLNYRFAGQQKTLALGIYPAAGQRMVDDYDGDAAVDDFIKPHPEAVETQVRAEPTRELAKLSTQGTQGGFAPTSWAL